MPKDHPIESRQDDAEAPAPAPVEAPKVIKVRALGRGYFGGTLRERGDVFVLADAKEFGVWMAPVDAHSTKALQHRIDAYKAQGFNAPRPPVDYSKVKPTPATRLK